MLFTLQIIDVETMGRSTVSQPNLSFVNQPALSARSLGVQVKFPEDLFVPRSIRAYRGNYPCALWTSSLIFAPFRESPFCPRMLTPLLVEAVLREKDLLVTDRAD